MTVYRPIIGRCWIVFLAVWFVLAMRRGTGRSSVSAGTAAQRAAVAIAIVLGVLLFQSVPGFPSSLPGGVAAAGCALCVAGVAFATWARVAYPAYRRRSKMLVPFVL
jgi:hypothetical protein